MGEIAGEARDRAAVRAEADIDAGRREPAQIGLGGLEELRKFAEMRIGRDALLMLRAAQTGEHVRANGAGEERIVEDRRRRAIAEHRGFARQGLGDLPDAAPPHRVDQRLIDRLIADAVDEAVDALLHQPPRIGEVEDMGDRAQPVAMGGADHRRAYLRRHGRHGVQLVIDPEFDEIRAVRGLAVDLGLGFRPPSPPAG